MGWGVAKYKLAKYMVTEENLTLSGVHKMKYADHVS